MELKISKDARKFWRQICSANDSQISFMGIINEILDDVETLEAALAAIPGPGALTVADWSKLERLQENLQDRLLQEVLSRRPAPDAQAVPNPVPGTSAFPDSGARDRDFDVPQAAPKAEPEAPTGGKWNAYMREEGYTEYAPAPTKAQDDAAVVEKIRNLLRSWHRNGMSIQNADLLVAVAVARKGMHTTEAVRAAIIEQGNTGCGWKEFVDGVVARLTALYKKIKRYGLPNSSEIIGSMSIKAMIERLRNEIKNLEKLLSITEGEP